MGVHWKVQFLGGGVREKPIFSGWIAEKGRLGQSADLKGGLAKKRGWYFWGGLRPQWTLWVGGAYVLTQWLIGIKYPKQTTFCDINTVILIIIIIIDRWFPAISKKNLVGLRTPKNST